MNLSRSYWLPSGIDVGRCRAIVARSGLFVAAMHPTTGWVLFGSREALAQGRQPGTLCAHA
jgi:hypothetical protein